MKKSIFTLLLICILVCGCSKSENNAPASTSTPTPTQQPVSTEYSVSPSDKSETKHIVKTLPFECPYNDTSFDLKEIGYYSFKDGKSQELAVVLTFDIKKLSDDDLEWLLDDIESNIYLTNEKNGIDKRKMSRIGNLRYTDSKELLIIYVPNLWDGSNRFAFEDCHLDINMEIKQLETFVKNGEKVNRIEYVDYSTNITKDDITPLSEASGNLEDFVFKKLKEYVDNVAKVMGQ